MKKTVKSTCCYCGVGCGLLVTREESGQVRVEGDPDHPVNRGALCSKGRSLHHVANTRNDRILRARIRRTREQKPKDVPMTRAIKYVAERFQGIIDEHGPDAVALYVSGQCLTEEYYLANKLMKGFIGSNNIDTNSRLCMSSAVAGYKYALGDDMVPVCYEDLDLCSCFLVTGANPAWCHPILWRRVQAKLQADPGAKLIVVDPRKTDSCAEADLHLQILPGQDITLHHAIASLLIQSGAIDVPFIEEHCEGFLELCGMLSHLDLPTAAAQCGVPESDIRLAATWIAESPTFMTLWTMGLNQSDKGTDTEYILTESLAPHWNDRETGMWPLFINGSAKRHGRPRGGWHGEPLGGSFGSI